MVGNLRRVEARNVHALVADAREPAIAPVDAVLIDVPCTGTGTFRRHPDARWRLKVSDLAVMGAMQRSIIRAAASVVRPGGLLIYSTCSLEPEENDAQVESFLAENPGLGARAAAGWRGASGRARRGSPARASTAPRDRRRVRRAASEDARVNWRATSRRLLPYALVAAGGFLLAYLIVAFVIFPPQIVPDDAKVPQVVGLLYDEAVNRLEAAGLQGEDRARNASSSSRRRPPCSRNLRRLAQRSLAAPRSCSM